MNIIISQIPIPIFRNTIQCLESIKNDINIQPLFWNHQHKPALDMFDEVQPEIVFIHESQIDQAFLIACQQFDFKYVLLSENPLPQQLVKIPNAILTHPVFIDKFSSNENVINLQPMASITEIHNAEYDEDLACDILVNTTGVEFTNEITNILLYLSNTYNVKIIGNNQVPLPQYLGQVNMVERANFIASCKVMIDFNQYDFWDASYLHIPSLSFYPTQPYTIAFNNIKTLKDSINSLLSNNLVHDRYVEECYHHTTESHTCYHAAAQIFNTIKEPDIENRLLQYVKEITTI
mgnify:CR=1 FL=1|tara:strand:- start:3373 stop:4248 length:876 start_codon:yes stop_codon:yes gene_type:complete